MTTDKFSIVYADPPWFYPARRNPLTRFGRGVSGQYPVMKTEEICALPIASLCADKCALLMWSTWPALEEAMRVIEAWGFEYKTIGFLWVKVNRKMIRDKPFILAQKMISMGVINFLNWLACFGVGFYTKSNTEPCLLAMRGSPVVRPITNTISSVVFAPRGRHSAKPPEVREKIVELFGDIPRVELFAREASPGWGIWGNEVESTFEMETVAKHPSYPGLTVTRRKPKTWAMR